MFKMYKELFTQAMKPILQGMDYVQEDCSFYLYRRPIQVVELISFDMISGGGMFYVFGGAAAFCNAICVYPNNQLSIGCYDVNDYLLKQGKPSLDNRCFSDNTGLSLKRYSKKQFIEQLDKNLELFRNTLLSDILKIKSLDDYYSFKVKGDAYGHIARIPFPTIDSFNLCIQLGKIYEASIIVFQMLRRNDPYLQLIDKILSMRIIKATQDMEYVEDICEFILHTLEANLDKFRIELDLRIDESRRICDQFFEKRRSR